MMVKRTDLGRRVADLMRKTGRKIIRFPLPMTTTLGSLSLISYVGSGDEKALISALSLGAIADMSRSIVLKSRLRRLRSQESEIAKAVDTDYLKGIINAVREYYGYSGKCTLTELLEDQGGTAVFRGGYFINLSFKFEDGNEARLFFKYSRSNKSIGPELTPILRSMGYDFVPKSFFPSQHTRLDARHPNRGQFYELMQGQSLEKMLMLGESSSMNADSSGRIPLSDIFSRMFSIYADNHLVETSKHLLEKYKSHKSLINLIKSPQGKKYEHFTNMLDSEFRKLFESAETTLIHGDLHQGNIIINDNLHIIDWDTAQLGIPYYDFFYLAVITDFDRSQSFEQVRDQFVKLQSEIMPDINQQQLKMIEFETYLLMLERYYKTRKFIKADHKHELLRSCKYLLERARKSLQEYIGITHNNKLLESFEEFSERRYAQLKDVPFDPRASVAFAYAVSLTQSKKDKRGLAKKNLKTHQANIEEIVVIDESVRSPIIMDAAILGTLGIAVLGAGAYSYFSNQIDSRNFISLVNKIAPKIAVLFGAAYCGYNREKVINKIRKAYEGIIGLKKKH
ncbi:hypothetical protein D6745_04750 [Candidatus Woesearchaeota archaeon]|nr:MAG: hypothetical protein D6745_04750 [Candidatus Woesearchaeota archaeon]